MEAGVLDGAGNTIRADGETVTLISNDEGAGGGGAGGTLVLRVDDIVSTVIFSVRGGKGGDTQNILFLFNCDGPGGGGGGGYITTSLGTWPAIGLVTTDVSAGAPGNVLHTTGDCGFPSTSGAEAGLVGMVAFDLSTSPTLPDVHLGPDLALCAGDTITLIADAGFDTYLWSDGSIGSTLEVSTAGTYTVEVTNGCGLDRDTVVVTLEPIPPLNLGDDQALCEGDELEINAGSGFLSYLWSDGSSDSVLTVNAIGTYTVQVTYGGVCNLTDSLSITEIWPLPFPDLGPDISICEGEQVTLATPTVYTSYNWFSGESTSSILAEIPGNYGLTVLDANGCMGSDSLILDYLPTDSCETEFIFPNAFTPNGDGLNDIFRPVVNGALPLAFEMILVNRWGQTIFASNDYHTGWDGTFQGKDAEIGSYIWQARMTLIKEGQAIEQSRAGTITIIR